MRVWVVKIGEPLPVDDGSPRLMRAGMLANALAARGHSVTWVSGAFDHWKHRARAVPSSTPPERPGSVRLVLLPSPGYPRSTSPARLVDHAVVALRFRRLLRAGSPPDIIVCAYPTIELAALATSFGRRTGVPVVLDVRDLWPDIFERALPRLLAPLFPLMVWPVDRIARRALGRADGVTAITTTILEWGLAKAGRSTREFDRVFPLAFEDPMSDAVTDADAAALEGWRSIGVGGSDEFVVAFAGTLSGKVDVEGLVGAAHRLHERSARVRFVICGTGTEESRLRRETAALSNVTMTGWVDQAALRSLMRIAHAGLLPYRSFFDFEASIPNKPIEYMAFGLPVVSSLARGELADLLRRERCGTLYSVGDGASLAARLSDLADAPDRGRATGAAGRRVFESRFSASVVYSAFAEHIERVAARSRVRP